MVEFDENGNEAYAWSDGRVIASLFRLDQYHGKTIWKVSVSPKGLFAHELKEIAEYMMTRNEREEA